MEVYPRGCVFNVGTKRVDCKPPPLAIVSPQYDSTHRRKCACTHPPDSDTLEYLHLPCWTSDVRGSDVVGRPVGQAFVPYCPVLSGRRSEGQA